jgi:two-component system, cell cycle sensor histidine kinase and response regulator CckA
MILVRTAVLSADLSGTVRSIASRSGTIVAIASVVAVVSVFVPVPSIRLLMSVGAITLCFVAIGLRFVVAAQKFLLRQHRAQISILVGDDAAPCFTTDTDGEIGYQNIAAVKRFAVADGQTLAAALGDHFISPSAVLYRLQSRAAARGAAREDIVTRRGHTRLSVHRIGEAWFLWRLEEMLERSGPGRGAETLSLPMMVANKSGVVLFMNEAMRRLLGGRPRRLDRIFVNPVLRSGEETLVTTLDGQVRAILAEVEGAGERRELYLLPLSEREAADTIQADFEHLPVALIMLNADGAVKAANLAARELLHLPEGAVQRLPDLLEGLGRSVSDWISDVLAERIPGGTEVLRVRHSEKETFLQVTLRRIVDAGRPSVLAVIDDATALKALEAQFVQSQKMQGIGQLAGGIAHDFNNLLTAISGHCDLLLLRQDADGPEYADLVQISQNANRAASLVSQLLAFSRKQTLRPVRIELYDVLSELTHLLNRLIGGGMRLELRHAPGLGPIRADKSQLEQVLVNLVVNARDAMDAGGTISISTEAVVLEDELRRDRAVVPPGRYAVIRVADSGHGIAPDRLQKIFEPFYTTKRLGEGTGLGLSTAYGIVKQSGGFIFVDSTPGEGSTFLLYFPIHDVALDDDPGRAPQVTFESRRPLARQGEGVVLLVEDEAPVRAFASRALRLRGYTVLEAGNAEEALLLLEDPAVYVDIFVTDVVMPGMDGPSWVRKALERRPNVKVVFVSGYAEESFAETQGRIANSVFLPKPFSLNDLTATVQGQLLH